MPRIGGGGGPFVPPQAQGAQQAQGTQATQRSDFANRVSQASAQGTDAARAQQAQRTQQSQMTGKAREIARRLASGALSQKEATQEFVSLVIEERLPHFKKKRRRKQGEDEQEGSAEERLEEAVTELIDRDPALAKRFEAQFKKLAQRG
jgi:hypothetical protein